MRDDAITKIVAISKYFTISVIDTSIYLEAISKKYINVGIYLRIVFKTRSTVE
jgi:hypothetical protein